MADDLERLMRSIEGEGPSPDFVAHLREQLVTELNTAPDERDDVTVVDLSSGPDTERHRMTMNRWILTTAAAAIIAIVGIVALTIRDDSQEIDVVDIPTTVTTTEGADPASSLPSFPSSFGNIPLDTYLVDTLGEPFAVTIDSALWTQDSREGMLALSRPSSDGPGNLALDFLELRVLWDPTQPDINIRQQGDGWPADDMDGFIANLPEGVTATNRVDITVDGRPGVQVDLTLEDIDCVEVVERDFCIGLVLGGPSSESSNVNIIAGMRGIAFGGAARLWVIDRGDEAPLAVIASVRDLDDLVFFDSVQSVVESIRFSGF